MYCKPFIGTYNREYPSSICPSSMLFVQVFGISDRENSCWNFSRWPRGWQDHNFGYTLPFILRAVLDPPLLPYRVISHHMHFLFWFKLYVKYIKNFECLLYVAINDHAELAAYQEYVPCLLTMPGMHGLQQVNHHGCHISVMVCPGCPFSGPC
jgi:hypothetical protein